ncbi:MAG TPA: poly-gamma-glutamate system protein [Terriglobales bacterium]|nr:poly-gamma-glutamate system protein [Terriglobales bacterium]
MNGDRRRLTPSSTIIYVAGAAGLLFLAAMNFTGGGTSLGREMTAAARLMARAEAAVRECRSATGLRPAAAADPNATGLIGLETSPITTSLGDPAAKRTTTNPDFAALVVSLLDEAGVRRGDAVAVGASSSFPALVIATLAAARAMGADPLVISSLGASEWGANDPAFTWLDMAECLSRAAGPLDVRPVALAVGGEEDVGRNMEPAGRALLIERIRASGLPFVDEAGLAANVAERVRLYAGAAGGRPLRAFVNIGGSSANIGTNAEVLKLRPGLVREVFIPPPAERGVLQEMAARKVPVIHLLNVRGLCRRYGLPWDPRPLPPPGAAGLYRRAAVRGRAAAWPSAVYVLLVAAFLASRKRSP